MVCECLGVVLHKDSLTIKTRSLRNSRQKDSPIQALRASYRSPLRTHRNTNPHVCKHFTDSKNGRELIRLYYNTSVIELVINMDCVLRTLSKLMGRQCHAQPKCIISCPYALLRHLLSHKHVNLREKELLRFLFRKLANMCD